MIINDIRLDIVSINVITYCHFLPEYYRGGFHYTRGCHCRNACQFSTSLGSYLGVLELHLESSITNRRYRDVFIDISNGVNIWRDNMKVE